MKSASRPPNVGLCCKPRKQAERPDRDALRSVGACQNQPRVGRASSILKRLPANLLLEESANRVSDIFNICTTGSAANRAVRARAIRHKAPKLWLWL